MEKPQTTLFMLSSVDGKISTGASDERDVDKDYKKIAGIKEGLQQYYDLEQETDSVSFNTGRVMTKIGINEKKIFDLDFMTFVIVDNSHLTENGVKNLASGLGKLFLVTKNKNHPAFNLNLENLEIIFFEKEIDFVDLFEKLKKNFGIEKMTIQSGSTMNSILLRKNLIDEISIVVAPALVGGENTPTLIGGKDIFSEEDLKNINALELISCEKLKNSFLHLRYRVLKNN